MEKKGYKLVQWVGEPCYDEWYNAWMGRLIWKATTTGFKIKFWVNKNK